MCGALACVPSTAAATHVSVRIVDASQRELSDSGRLRVRVSSRSAARVRLTASVRRGEVTTELGRATRRVRRGRTTVSLTLSRRARRALEGCGPGAIDVAARRLAGQRRRPVFTGRARARTSRALRLDGPRCLPRIRAGASAVDVTPPVGTPMFAYTARSGIANPENTPEIALQIVADPDRNLYARTFVASRGIHTRTLARAVVIETDRGKFALVQVDLGGVPYTLTHEVLQRVRATGITGERLLLSATHTHSAHGAIWPNDSNGYAFLGGDAFDPRIFELTAQGIANAIVQAD